MSIGALSLSVIAVASIILLATKELAMIKPTKASVRYSKPLNAAVIIVVALFILSLALRIIDILRTVPE